VELKRGRVDLHAQLVEGLPSVLARGDRRILEHYREIRTAEVREPAHTLWVARGHHDLEKVPGEVPGALHEVGGDQLLHVRLVCGGDDIRTGTGLDLRYKPLGASETAGDR